MSAKANNLLYFFSLLLVLFYSIMCRLETDEAEHIHFAWLNSLGYRPFLDYWQHHMPLIWDILAPIFLLGDNVLATIAIRLITGLIFIISADWTLKHFLGDNTLFRAVFLLFAFFPLYRLSIRPELFAFPIYCYFLVDLSKTSQRYELTVKTAIFLALGLLLTPRLLPILIIYLLGYMFSFRLKNIRGEIKKWLSIVLPLILITHFLYDLEDLSFFVIEQSSNYTYNYSNGSIWSGKLRTFWLTYLTLAVFLAVTLLYAIYVKKNKVLILLSFIQIILCSVEAGPFTASATFFVSFLNFIFFIRLVSLSNRDKFIFGIAAFLVIMSVVRIKETLGEGSLYSQLFNYQHTIDQCGSDHTVQSRGFSRILIYSPIIHPIFVRDATYFGFFQSIILTPSGFYRVMDYNKKRSRSISYISETEPECLGSMKTFNEIKSIVLTW